MWESPGQRLMRLGKMYYLVCGKENLNSRTVRSRALGVTTGNSRKLTNLVAINFNRSGEFAKPILHQTYKYPDGNHLVGLEVYHALHCIVSLLRSEVQAAFLTEQNNVRKTLYYDHYVDDFPVSKKQWETHISKQLMPALRP